MTTGPGTGRVEDGIAGAIAALETLDEILGEFLRDRGLRDSEPVLSVNDFRHLIRGAKQSIETRKA